MYAEQLLPRRMIMNILIIGCGDTGSQLANVLDDMGNQVSVVDRDPETASEPVSYTHLTLPTIRLV